MNPTPVQEPSLYSKFLELNDLAYKIEGILTQGNLKLKAVETEKTPSPIDTKINEMHNIAYQIKESLNKILDEVNKL